jgi:galactose mutarotase-like enzyme
MSCRLTNTQIDGLKAIVLENELLRMGILPGRGCDIYEFFYKPLEQDYLLRLAKGIRNPSTHFSQIRDTARQFEDYYYGGWQVCLPNSHPFTYRGAHLGQHGEVSLIPWRMEITNESEEVISVTCITEVLRLPIRIQRTFTLKSGESLLCIAEEVKNIGKTPLNIMWGQHIAFGLPFLEEGATIDTNALTIEAEMGIPEPFLLERSKKFQWPQVKTSLGKELNASRILPKGEGVYSELAYLEGYPSKAYYSISNNKSTFRLTWDGDLFRTLWMWQERNAIKDFPWWGDCFTVALEPWTSRWTSEPEAAIEAGEWLTLEPGVPVRTSFKAEAFKNEFKSLEQ